mmetsp:Transcript_17321/g.55898  ORF Transcript_17321/g.55898 Transcript_17321/m.55898 type:complete len:385 (-) Transcript_17321:82-1236(-)
MTLDHSARITAEAGDGSLNRAATLLVSIAVAIVACSDMSTSTLLPPNAGVWLEVACAFGLGSISNMVLSMIVWREWPRSAVGAACVASLCAPYLLPFRYGIAASAVALLNFIGVWKASDVLAGTAPAALSRSGRVAFAVHFASPVEYVVEQSVASASSGLWRTELSSLLQVYAALALTASAHAALLPPPADPAPAALREAVRLYCEVWTIYLFLRLFTGAFGTMLACGGFVPRTMWRAPLLASTSAADFWGRRWNLLIHGLFRRTVFRPLTERGVPGWGAGAIAFALSGAFHEYAFALQQPAQRASFGRCLAFFLAQAPAVSAEKRLRRLLGVPPPFDRSSAACTLAWTLLLMPFAPLFLHPLKTSGTFATILELVPRLAVAVP